MSLKQTLDRLAAHTKEAEQIAEPEKPPVYVSAVRGANGRMELQQVVPLGLALFGSRQTVTQQAPIDPQALEDAVRAAAVKNLPTFHDWRQDSAVAEAQARVDDLLALRERGQEAYQRAVERQRRADVRLAEANAARTIDVDAIVAAQAEVEAAAKDRQRTLDGVSKLTKELGGANAAVKTAQETASAAVKGALEAEITAALADLTRDFHAFDVSTARYRALIARAEALGGPRWINTQWNWRLPDFVDNVRLWLASLARDGALS